jgi:hypothetical protein
MNIEWLHDPGGWIVGTHRSATFAWAALWLLNSLRSDHPARRWALLEYRHGSSMKTA